jgi:hypothetical protein
MTVRPPADQQFLGAIVGGDLDHPARVEFLQNRRGEAQERRAIGIGRDQPDHDEGPDGEVAQSGSALTAAPADAADQKGEQRDKENETGDGRVEVEHDSRSGMTGQRRQSDEDQRLGDCARRRSCRPYAADLTPASAREQLYSAAASRMRSRRQARTRSAGIPRRQPELRASHRQPIRPPPPRARPSARRHRAVPVPQAMLATDRGG